MNIPSDIPEELHSEYEERPFQSCTRCGESLEDFEEGYQISKIYRAEECIMEYAICYHCHTSMLEEFSQSSRDAMQRYQAENVRGGLGMHVCAVCDNKREAGVMKEYGLAAICFGMDMIEAVCICGGCSEKMQEVISEETRDRWNKFIEENFPCAPNEVNPEPAKPAGIPVF